MGHFKIQCFMKKIKKPKKRIKNKSKIKKSKSKKLREKKSKNKKKNLSIECDDFPSQDEIGKFFLTLTKI